MFAFLVILVVILLAATLWTVLGSRKQSRPVAIPTPQRPFAHAQARPLDIPTHMNGQGFAQLLRAAKGDRSVVESWIMTEQRRNPQFDRDSTIERIAARFNQARSD
jgi:hypothetical protein